MSARRFSDFESAVDEIYDVDDSIENFSTKLERRRRIEELTEAKMLREELADFDYE